MGASVLPVLGGIAEAGIGYLGQRSANTANAQQAQKQMDFQREMSNTAYQRAVEDMKKAGLNPGMAYFQGGASTPTGASAQMQNTLAGVKGTAQGAASTYATIQQTKADLAQKAAQTEQTKAQTQQLQMESLDRALSWSLGNRLTATNARFLEDTFDFRKQGLAQENVLRDTAIKDTNLTYQMNQKFKEQLTNQQLLLFPLQQELLRQNIANTAAHARDTQAHATLQELERPGAENIARADRTAFGRNIKPYLNNAQQVQSILGRFVPSLSLKDLLP